MNSRETHSRQGAPSPGRAREQEAALAAVLQALKGSPGPLSGEALAGELGLSRAAVWKRIQRLKDLGYDISGSPRRGYRLVSSPDKLWPQEILQGLRTRYLKGPVHHFGTLPSTNDLAKELGAQQALEGTLVIADVQTGGRGRLGRVWDSPEGGLYVSVLLRPVLPPTEMPQLTLTAAVAVVRALRRATGVTPGIKWPNDLILDGKKLGGILTEMETESDQIRHLVVGLGLNVNNSRFPAELEQSATSLARARGVSFVRLPIVRAWLEEFDELYGRFLAREFAGILAEWKEHTVTVGRMVTVRQGPREISGQALEVAADGALLLQVSSGEIVRISSGEIAPAL